MAKESLMRVEQLMSRPVQCCRPEDTLAVAAQLMWNNDCGFLPVVTGNGTTQIASVITDRDICMCALFKDKPLSGLRVSDAMSKQISACHAGDTLADAERIMREAPVRRLPVVDEGGMLVGVISLADLSQEASGATNEIDSGRTAVSDTLAAICAPIHKQLIS
jgi:CBS domain-containing protein